MVPRFFLFFLAAVCLGGGGCATTPLDRHVEEIQFEDGKLQKFTYYDETYGPKSDSSNFAAAIDSLKQADPLALPEMEGLPVPGLPKKIARSYTGIIKNQTRHEVSVPSQNSSGTLIIPPYGWIEYTAWSQFFNVTAYHDGKPFYCLKVHAHPNQYAFMCDKYDFIAEIVKPEPAPKQKPVKKKRKVKSAPKC
jgi:hypothetical protein